MIRVAILTDARGGTTLVEEGDSFEPLVAAKDLSSLKFTLSPANLHDWLIFRLFSSGVQHFSAGVSAAILLLDYYRKDSYTISQPDQCCFSRENRVRSGFPP